MCARVNNPVHVQVQIVEFHLVGVRLGRIDRNTDPFTFFTLWGEKDESKREDVKNQIHPEQQYGIANISPSLTTDLRRYYDFI